ncbi:MAG TPA: LysR family transcriptional regulator [Polyangia bacterium]|nr:LysR family transcriptional regulator [Polyangia bacterium]
MANPLRLLSPSDPAAPAAVIASMPFEADLDAVAPRRLPVPLNGPDIDLDSLRCFDAVATTLRFRSAAARVHLSPGAFSDRIGRLESVLGTRILQRTTRRVALTDAGERLLPVARRILRLVEHMPGAAIEDAAPPTYELVVGTRHEIGLSWLCAALDGLGRKRPERTIHLYNGASDDLVAKLERGELDAAVTSARLGSPRFTSATLHREDYVLVGVDRRLRGPEDAQRLTLVDVGPDLPLFRNFLDVVADPDAWRFGRVEHMGGIANVRHRLLGGDGRVAVLPAFFVKDDLAKRRFARLLPRVTLATDNLRLVWRANHPRQSELAALAGELREVPLR